MLRSFLCGIKENLYLIIPVVCICSWALAYLININFIQFQPFDFYYYYYGGAQILSNPANLYKEQPWFVYLPIFGISLAFSISLFPYFMAYYTFYCINIFAAILCVLEFNKILSLMEIKERRHRFLFLIIISNGYIIYYVFSLNQTKFVVALFVFFIIRRELQFKKNFKEKNIKFFIINYAFFVFLIGMYPIMILFFLIYLFHDILFIDLFKKKNIEKYIIAALMFGIENFLFFIFPNLIFDYFNVVINHSGVGWELFYLRDLTWYNLSMWFFYNNFKSYIKIIFTIILLGITLILLINKNLRIEEKFGFTSLSFIIFNHFDYLRALVIFLPLVLLLFIPFLKFSFKGVDFLKKNYIELIGIISVVFIYFFIQAETIIGYIHFFFNEFVAILVFSRYIFVLGILIFCILNLYIKNKYRKRLFNRN